MFSVFYLLQSFEWTVYAYFITFQSRRSTFNELLYLQKDFNRNEKYMTTCFILIALLMLGCQIGIEILDQDTNREDTRWLYLVPIIFNMVALVLSEILLEYMLAKEIKVQHRHHRSFLRFQLIVYLASLSVQFYLYYHVENYGYKRTPWVFMSLSTPAFMFTFVKRDQDCFQCFDKMSDALKHYTIFQISRQNSIFLFRSDQR